MNEINIEHAIWFRKRLQKWGGDNIDSFPWRKTDSKIHQLIAEILLQRTKAEQVVPIFERILKTYTTLQELRSLTLSEIGEIIYSLGLPQRAKYLYELFRILIEEYNGVIPNSFDEIKELPGVGEYIASAYFSFHHNIRYPIIDSNVVRVYGRFFGFTYDGETRRKKWLIDLANQITPKRAFKNYNYSILDFSRKICGRKPNCSGCTLSNRCIFNIGSSAV